MSHSVSVVLVGTEILEKKIPAINFSIVLLLNVIDAFVFVYEPNCLCMSLSLIQ